MDRIEEIETEISELENQLEEDLTDEQISEIEDKIKDLQSDLEDEWYIKKHGIYAYNGVSQRDFM